jgi:hypothetical protein
MKLYLLARSACQSHTGHLFVYAFASASRNSPTFQAVTRDDNFRGEGKVPRWTMRQAVAAETP